MDVEDTKRGSVPLILFGAFDRHNLGDLLFPHVVAALLPGRDPVFAGLVEGDLRSLGGYRVLALERAASRLSAAHLVHVGGELLTCDTWEAAVMTLPPDEAQSVIASHERDPAGRLEWAQRRLGIRRRAAYVASKRWLPRPGRLVFNAVGGVALDHIDPALRAEVLDSLAGADYLGVRERVTLEALARAGIEARLMPDPAVMVAELFGERIRHHGAEGEPLRMRQTFPQGYVAVQFSADFGDDATLSVLAGQLDRVAAQTGFGTVLFRAGAAPWHDDLETFRRAAARMRTPHHVFRSLDIWDICALIEGSRGYCGSSLHGRIVAAAFALPRVSLAPPASGSPSKVEAYARTWEPAHLADAVPPGTAADGLLRALATGRDALQRRAVELAAEYRQRFAEWSGLLGDDASVA